MSDDEDSLFGSPPPSPHASRPASPVLALPRSSSSGSRPSTSTAPLTQNVGTIALPGSHPDSELPMNPLALSLNHGIVQWPPAHPAHPASLYVLCTPSSSSTPSASSTRASTPRLAPPKKTIKKRRKESEPPPQPTGPEFVLPDPSEPPPANFLRNQENLLGRAGRVAGVKLAAITHTRGTSSSNPILIEDDEPDTPIIGRRRARDKSSQPYIDPSLLTAPTNQEIVQVLIGQKDIFPILEGVLKLVMRSTPGGSTQRPTRPQPTLPVRTGFERRHPSAPPLPAFSYATKKRKLNRVPAGAADWDVPYPFEAGDGPDSYQNTWERQRGKRLISELIKLIKNAARKAATKKYLQEEEARRRDQEGESQTSQFGSTSTFPPWLQSLTTDQQSTPVPQDTSNSVTSRTPNTSTSTPIATTASAACNSVPTPETSDAAFNQLMASLSGAIPNEQQTSVNPLYVTQQQDKTDGVSSVDQPIFDTWMSFLETLPMSFNGTPSTSTGDHSSQCSTPAISDFDFSGMQGLDASAGNLSFAQASEEYDAMIASIFNAPPPSGVPDMAPTPTTSGPVVPPPALPFDENLIDPSLMELSMQASAFQIPVTAMTTTSGADFSTMMNSSAHGAGAVPPSQAHLHVGQGQVQAPAVPSSGPVVPPPALPFDESLIDPSLMQLSMQASAFQIPMSAMTAPSSADFSAMMDLRARALDGGAVPPSRAHLHVGRVQAQAPSPVASTSSAGNNDPSTPVSAAWDLSTPDVFMDMDMDMGAGGGVLGQAEGGLVADDLADWGGATAGFAYGEGEGVQPRRVDKGKQRAVEPFISMMPPTSGVSTTTTTSSSSSSSTTTILSGIPIPPTESIISTLLQTPAGTPGLSAALSGTSLFVPKAPPPPRLLRRDEVVRRAQARRKELQEELDRVKMQLWETTVEQAGVMTLMRRMDG